MGQPGWSWERVYTDDPDGGSLCLFLGGPVPGNHQIPPSGRAIPRGSAGEGRASAAVEEVGAVRQQVEVLGHQVERLVGEIHQLREVLAARLPGPPALSTPQPRVRWRACVEVALLGVVTGLAGAMVARVLQINGAIVLPW